MYDTKSWNTIMLVFIAKNEIFVYLYEKKVFVLLLIVLLFIFQNFTICISGEGLCNIFDMDVMMSVSLVFIMYYMVALWRKLNAVFCHFAIDPSVMQEIFYFERDELWLSRIKIEFFEKIAGFFLNILIKKPST